MEERRRRVYIATMLLGISFFSGTVGFYVLGRGEWGVEDCAYMTAVTLTTVGYDETVPVSTAPGGRLFTILFMLGGVAALLYFASTFMAFIVEGDLRALLGSKRMEKITRNMKNHYIVCGVGRTGRHTVRMLYRADLQVVMVDQDKNHLKDIASREEARLPYVVGDCTDEAVLKDAGIERAKGLFCALNSDQANLYTVLTAKEINPKLRVVAKVSDGAAARKFKMVGADEVVAPTELGGKRLFAQMIEPAAVYFLEQLTLPDKLDLMVREIKVAASSPLAGQTLAEADLRRQVGNVLILAIRLPANGDFTYNPKPTSRLVAGASVMAMGGPEEIERFRELAR
jgi:voltage-gated potassium channel